MASSTDNNPDSEPLLRSTNIASSHEDLSQEIRNLPSQNDDEQPLLSTTTTPALPNSRSPPNTPAKKYKFNITCKNNNQDFTQAMLLLLPSIVWIFLNFGSTSVATNDYMYKYFADRNHLNVSFSNMSYCNMNESDPNFIKLQKVQAATSRINQATTIFSLLPTVLTTVLFTKISDVLYVKYGHRFYFLSIVTILALLLNSSVTLAIYRKIPPDTLVFKCVLVFQMSLVPYSVLGPVIFQILNDTFTDHHLWLGNVSTDMIIGIAGGMVGKLFALFTDNFWIPWAVLDFLVVMGLVTLPFVINKFPINYEKHKQFLKDSIAKEISETRRNSGDGDYQRTIRRQRALSRLSQRLDQSFHEQHINDEDSEPNGYSSVRHRRSSATSPMITSNNSNFSNLLSRRNSTSNEILPSYLQNQAVEETQSRSIKKTANIYHIMTKPRQYYDRIALWGLFIMWINNGMAMGVGATDQLIQMNKPICMSNYELGNYILFGQLTNILAFVITIMFPSLWRYHFINVFFIFCGMATMSIATTKAQVYCYGFFISAFNMISATTRTFLAQVVDLEEYSTVLNMFYLLQTFVIFVMSSFIFYFYSLVSSGHLVYSFFGVPVGFVFVLVTVGLKICFYVKEKGQRSEGDRAEDETVNDRDR